MDSKQTVDRFNDALMYLVKHFDDRPFQKMGNRLTSRALYSLNKKLGERMGRYNSEILMPGLKLSEANDRIIYACPAGSDLGEVRINYYPSKMNKFKKPMMNIRTYNPEETLDVVDLLKALGLNPTVDSNEPFWDSLDVWAPL